VRPIRRRHAATLGALAAAAAAGLLLIPLAREDEPDSPEPAELYAALNPPRPFVETPAGVRAAVIRTDRNLTLVLLYPEEIDR
jgi:hypothetical protein